MKKQLLYLPFFLIIAFFNAQAQRLSSAKNSSVLFVPHSGLCFSVQKCQSRDPQISLAKNYAATSLPFFCNMESKLHRRANVWIKLRTGNDESYMRLISPARRP